MKGVCRHRAIGHHDEQDLMASRKYMTKNLECIRLEALDEGPLLCRSDRK